jgi:hypothetical protein
MSFLLSLISLFNILTVRIDWINDFLTIELNQNIDNYSYLPEASLYINDVLVKDPRMFYERNGVEWTFISTVNTKVVRAYNIKYRVNYPTYNISQVKTITFNVVDLIAPEFVLIPEFSIPLGQKLPNLQEGLVFKDNYDSVNDISVQVNASKVILNKIGVYEIVYQLRDLSNNTVTAKGKLEVYDHLPPTISIKKDFILPFGTTFVWSNFLSITDNYDSILEVVIHDSGVNYSKLGRYPITIQATDQSGLSSEVNQMLTILDTEKPRITIKSQEPVIPVYSKESESLLKSFILNVTDNYDYLKIEDVSVTHDIEWDVLGEYTIYYALTDHSMNKLETHIKVRVKDLVKPSIWFTEPLVFSVFDEVPFINQLIGYEDNYDLKSELNLKITTTFKMNVIGKYPITVEVSDTSGNKEVLQSYIQVVDLIPPKITQVNDIIITDFSKKIFDLYFNLEDNYDVSTQLKLAIDDQLVKYDEIGSYPIIVYATDLSSNQTILVSEIIVIDLVEPILELKQYALFLQVDSEIIDLKSLIKEASDNYDDLTRDDVEITGDIVYDQIGLYKISYFLRDSSMNVNKRELQVIIDDKTSPVITSTPLQLFVNQTFNPYEGVYVEDNLGEYELFIFPQIVDTSSPGKKKITYVAVDSRGNYTTYIREIIVLEEDKILNITSYLPLVIVTLIGISSIYYIYKKA